MAHTSTSIEGNQLKEYQVKELAEGKKVVAEVDEIREVENYLTPNGRVFVLTSSLTKGIKWPESRKTIVGRKKLFFEELFVWELAI